MNWIINYSNVFKPIVITKISQQGTIILRYVNILAKIKLM